MSKSILRNSSFSYIFKIIYLFIFGCAGSSLLHISFLQLATGGYCLVAVYSLSLQWLLLLWSMGPGTHRPSRYNAGTQLPHDIWDLTGPGIEPVSPALTDRFLTTGPPGKSQFSLVLR